MEIITKAVAKAQGLAHYFTGKPCKRGHLTPRKVSDGHCPICQKDAARANYLANKARCDAARDRYRERNREKVMAAARERRRQAYAANPEAGREASRRYRASHPDKVSATNRQWHAANKERSNERSRKWKASNPENLNQLYANKRARKRGAEGRCTVADIGRIYAEQRGRCAYCRRKLGKILHREHIIPISKGGTNWPSNIQLACGDCNLRKHAKDPIAFAQELGRLL